MTRISLVDGDATPEIAALAAKIRGARRGQLHVFYRALLHNPALAAAWFDFNSAVRFGTGLVERIRELAIMRVAALTGCEYVWGVHERQYAAGAGLTPQEVQALRDPQRGAAFTPAEKALLSYVDAMTRDVEVPEAVFGELRRHCSEREIVELTVLVGAYNMQCRLLRALDVQPERA